MNTNVQNLHAPRPKRGVGSYVAGIFQCIIGGCMVFGFGIGLLITIFDSYYYYEMAAAITLMLFFIASCLLLARGVRQCKRFVFGRRVRAIMQGREREQLMPLAEATKRDLSSLVRDLRMLSERGVFPGAYVDLNRREFVVVPGGNQPPIAPTDTQLKEKRKKSVAPIYAVGIVFLAYALVLPMYRMTDYVIVSALALLICVVVARIAPARTVIVEEARKTEPPRPAEKIDTGNEELDEVLDTAMQYMNELTALDIAITNERIDKPLKEMVHICKQIFEYIKKSPEKVRQIRQFMNYYLPTTIRLLKSYDELSREQVKGDNIRETMGKIEDTMQTILKAFQKELDDLYKDKAMDISVDIEVLKNMMEQEGLDGDILELHKKEA